MPSSTPLSPASNPIDLQHDKLNRISLDATAQAPASNRPNSLLDRIVESPYTPWSTSAILLATVPLCVKNPVGFPPLVQLPLFAGVFGLGGYMTQAGDPLNGAGTTCAWSASYLVLHLKRAVVAKRPGPLALSSIVAVQAGTFAAYYFRDNGEDAAAADNDQRP